MSDSKQSLNVDSKLHIDQVPEDEKQAMLDFHASLRRVLAVHGMINPGVEKFQELTMRINALADEMESFPRGRPFLRFTGRMPADDPNIVIPFSPITGRFSAMALPMELSIEGDMVVGTGVYNEAYEGPNNCVHGGVVSEIYDQLLSLAGVPKKVGGPTGELTIRYLKPTPLHVPLRFEAWVDQTEGRKITAKGRCFANDQLVTEADGVFIRLDESRSYPAWSNRAQSHDERKG